MLNGANLTTETMDMIINHSGALVYVIDLMNYKILYANELCQEEFGNIIGHTCYSVLQKDQMCPCRFCPLPDANTIFDFPEGSVFEWDNKNSINQKYYLFKDRIVRLLNGRLVKIQIGIDITQQKLLETQLLQQRDNAISSFQTLIDATIEGLIIYNEHKQCIYVNHVSPILFGYSEEEMLLKNALEFIAPTSYEHVRKIMQNGYLERYEALMKRKDGTIFPALLRSHKVTLAGQYVQILAILDISTMKEKEEKILKLALYDQLTGLLNREKLVMDIETLFPTACAIFNIDAFREMNDFFGINIGDQILIQLAEEWKKMELTAYRIGGDEFAVLFYEEMSRNTLYDQIRQIHTKLHTVLFVIEGESINLRMRVGAALANEKLLTRADIALHTAKEKKLSIAIYEEEENIEKTYKKNIAMTTQIHKALSEKRIICHYQPVIDCTNDKIFKYETLVRMVDEKGNLISPMEFLPIAKKTKLYTQITIEVIQQACRLFAQRQEPFSVNLSIEDINDNEVVQKIIHTITTTNTAHQITFEILESEGIENYDSVANFIAQAQSLGARIAIDDFGTGYSNFEHILKLNIDFIKIDGSLITGIANHLRHRIIVETISNFAQKIGAKTIAEFVSTEETYTTLKSIGIDYAQGYYLGKPAKLSSIPETIF